MDQRWTTEDDLDKYNVAKLTIHLPIDQKNIVNAEILLFSKSLPGYIKGHLNKHDEDCSLRVCTNTDICISQPAEDTVRSLMDQLIKQVEKKIPEKDKPIICLR